jgi:hypothetical protein
VRRIAPAIVCLAILLAGCGETSTIRPHATERTVTTFVVKHTGYHPADMRCPAGVPAEVGTRFQCHFSGPEGPYTAYVRILSVDGERVVDHIVTRPSRNGGSDGSDPSAARS